MDVPEGMNSLDGRDGGRPAPVSPGLVPAELPGQTREKPPYKAPCNGCGLCCMRRPCSTGILLFKTDKGPCPALQWTADGSSACGLMVDPARYAPTRARIKGALALRQAMKVAQAAGAGCTMPDPGQSPDPEWRKSIRASVELQLKARKTWGLPNDATPSLMDGDRLRRVFARIGETVTFSTTLCVIGSAPGILLGQPGRQTQDVDVWGSQTVYDEAELRRACRGVGVEVYLDGEKHGPDRDSYIHVVEPGVSVRIMERAYVHVVMPGAVVLPEDFPVMRVGEFGRLLVLMPEPALLVATKLVRGSEKDIVDANWWVKERALTPDKIQAAIDTLPAPAKQEAAVKNMAQAFSGG